MEITVHLNSARECVRPPVVSTIQVKNNKILKNCYDQFIKFIDISPVKNYAIH